MRAFVVLVMAAMATGPAALAQTSLRPLLDAIRQVETGGRVGANGISDIVGDNGRSLGPYQIQRPYWQDSRVPGEYRDVRRAAYAEKVMIAYWQRYCPAALTRGDWATLARIHNGGPQGHKKAATLGYWQKVKRAMDVH